MSIRKIKERKAKAEEKKAMRNFATTSKAYRSFSEMEGKPVDHIKHAAGTAKYMKKNKEEIARKKKFK